MGLLEGLYQFQDCSYARIPDKLCFMGRTIVTAKNV